MTSIKTSQKQEILIQNTRDDRARYAANQSGAQRFLTMKTQKDAQIATMINAPGYYTEEIFFY